MKKRMIKNLLLVVVMAVLCVAVGMTASAEDRVIVDSGECGAEGDNVIWTLYDDGELVISGEGKMEDYIIYYEDEFSSGSSSESQPWGYAGISKVTIMDGVTYIGRGTLNYRDTVESLTVAESVNEIAEDAFKCCSNLANIQLPNKRILIGRGVFYDTVFYNDEENWEDGVLYVGKHIIEAKTSISGEYAIKEGTLSIAKDAFYRCTEISKITVPDSVEVIDDNTFAYCENLSVYLPKSVVNIGDLAFVGCNGVFVDRENSYYLSDENGVLYNKNITELIHFPSKIKIDIFVVPYSVKTIGEGAFYQSFIIKEVVLPEGLESIKNEAFYGCYSLNKINLPNSIKTIGMYAFGECYGLSEIIVPKDVEYIGTVALSLCPFLDNIYVKTMNAVLKSYAIGANQGTISGISKEDFVAKIIQAFTTDDEDLFNSLMAEIESYLTVYPDAPILTGTIYCHAGSTAEKYAIENGVDYELTHFFEGEWTYDYDNMIRYRKCIHCDELETEALETTGDSDVEIIEPVDPDTDFTVDVVEDYVVIEETISNNITTDFEIVKAFDINLKNKDGVHVQPDGTVKVKLPLDWEKDGVYKVYRVNDDGTLTDMNAYREGSHMVFDTDHFSIYVIVDESEKADAPTTPDEPQEETKDNFFTRLLDLIKSFFDLIMSWFKK